MKLRIAAALTVAASLFVATTATHAAEEFRLPKDSFLLEVSGVKELDRVVDQRAVGLMEMVGDVGIGKKPMTPEELRFLLEVSGIRMSPNVSPEELGFLLEVSGLRSRPMNMNDARVLVIAAGLGLKMHEPDLEFTCADDLANILLMARLSDELLPPSTWIIMIGEVTGFLMD